MHIVIAAITAVAGLFWALTALRNSGFQFSSLNPFLAIRRWRWSTEYNSKPLFKLSRPMDAAAVLLAATARADGAISTDQKQAMLRMFSENFQLSESEASELWLATTHLLRDELSVAANVDKVLERSANGFEREQVADLLAMMRKIAAMDGAINEEQQRLIAGAEAFFASRSAPKQAWR